MKQQNKMIVNFPKVENNPSKELKTSANELVRLAKIEPVELLPAEPESLTEKIEVTFFQRYLRTKKVTEKTKFIYQSLVKEIVRRPIESSKNKEYGFEFYEQFEEVEQPVKFINPETKKEEYKFKVRQGTNYVELKKHAFGNQWKVETYYKKDEGNELNLIIGRAVAKLREEFMLTNAKGLNKAQPIYIAVPVAEGLVISNFQLYGTRNKQAGLKGKNMVNGGNESDFAKATIQQLKIVVERMKGNEMEVCKEWKALQMEFPDIKNLKRKTN